MIFILLYNPLEGSSTPQFTMSEAGFQYLALKNPHVRDADISFKDIGHEYKVLGKVTQKSEGWLSSTGFVHSDEFWEHFDPDSTITMIMKSKKYREGNSPYSGMTRQEIKDDWEQRGSEACRLGSKFHLGVESHYNNETFPDDPEMAELKVKFMKFVEDHPHLTAYRTEFMVYDIELKLTGSIDILFQEPDGSISIYDWKLSKLIETGKPKFPTKSHHPVLKKYYSNNYSQYSMQLNVYKYILEKNYGFKIKDLYLVRFYHDVETYEKIKCLDMSKEIDTLFRIRLSKLAGEGVSEDEEDEPQFVRRVSLEPPKKGPDFSECML